MSEEPLNVKVLDSMKKTGAFMKLYSFFLLKIDEEAQNQDIPVMKPYRKFKNTKADQIAADLVMQFLNSKKYTNTIESIKLESKNSEIFESSSSSLHEKELSIAKSSHPIQSLVKEWMKNVTDPFYENRDRLAAEIQRRYSRLDDNDEVVKSPLPNYSVPPPLKPVKGESPKEEKPKSKKSSKKSPESVKLPPPLVPSNQKKKASKPKPKEPSIDETYSVTGTTTESVEPWNPMMGIGKNSRQGGNLQLPKPQVSLFTYKQKKAQSNSYDYSESD